MTDDENYWTRNRLSRRGLLRGAAVAGFGLAGAALIGCGDDDDEPAPSAGAATAAPTSVGQTLRTATVAPTEAAAGIRRGGRIQFYSSAQAPNLDPTLSLSYQTHHRVSLIYSFLVELLQGPARDLRHNDFARPGRELEASGDGLTWTFNLRPGLKWANVAPMNGRDLTAGGRGVLLRAQLAPRGAKPFPLPHARRDPEGRRRPNGSLQPGLPPPRFLFNLGSEPAEIQPRDAIEQEGDLKNWGAASGPFIMTKYEPAEIAEYQRNPNYYDADNVYVDGVDYFVIPDKATAIANFRSGNLDMLGNTNGMHGMRTSDREAILKSHPDSQVINYVSAGQSAIEIRFRRRAVHRRASAPSRHSRTGS